MNKINIPTDGVVIGSNTVAEHKFQVLNFMNMIYSCMVEKKFDNIRPWCSNLLYEIKCLKYDLYSKVNWYGFDVESHVNNMMHNILDGKNCKDEWNDLLKTLTVMFELKYSLN